MAKPGIVWIPSQQREYVLSGENAAMRKRTTYVRVEIQNILPACSAHMVAIPRVIRMHQPHCGSNDGKTRIPRESRKLLRKFTGPPVVVCINSRNEIVPRSGKPGVKGKHESLIL